MLNMNAVTEELIAARPYFRTINPSPSGILKGAWILRAKSAAVTVGALNQLRKGAPVAEMLGDVIGGRIIKKVTKPIKTRVTKVHLHMRNIDHDPRRKNGIGGRTWITQPGQYEMVIVFHDANRAGPHIDVHIGRFSVVYRVKPDLYKQLKYNNDGMLTENSRKLIVNHVRSEIQNGSRVPQNIDHSKSNARASWTGGDPNAKSYGSGRTRQVVSISTVDVYKAHAGGPVEMYAPLLNPHRGLYLYRLYEGDSKRAPILIWGAKKHGPPTLEDRLHLKMIDPKQAEKLITKADMSTSTAKYDGSSCYVVITPKGTTVWSPRLSKETGERIEYTYKLDGISHITSDETIVAMGELVFREKPKFPWTKTSHTYLPAATGSGILNSNQVLPKNIKPEIRLYRVDKIGRKKTGDLGFWENRELQERVAALGPQHLKVVALMTPEEAKELGYEGVVVAPAGEKIIAHLDGEGKEALNVTVTEDSPGSVNDAFKMKWWMDPHDWRIDKVEFKPGEKGGIAGVVRATSLESGKQFNLGPGQVGDRKLTEHMMNNPHHYEGAVMKVESRHGHEGRASKMVAFHDDKGVAVITD